MKNLKESPIFTNLCLKDLSGIPFYGSTYGEYDYFQFLLKDFSSEFMEISMPSWLQDRWIIKEFDIVNLHLSFEMGNHSFCKGRYAGSTKEEQDKGKTIRLKLLDEPFQPRSIYFEHRTEFQLKIGSAKPILHQLDEIIKECVLIKKGIFVYLKHLQNFFSRIIGQRNPQYPFLNMLLFEDAKAQLQCKIERLQNFSQAIQRGELPVEIKEIQDFKALCWIVESEISLDLFNISFKSNRHIPYITAIKDLEENLYWHYNSIVVLLYCYSVYGHRIFDIIDSRIKP